MTVNVGDTVRAKRLGWDHSLDVSDLEEYDPYDYADDVVEGTYEVIVLDENGLVPSYTNHIVNGQVVDPGTIEPIASVVAAGKIDQKRDWHGRWTSDGQATEIPDASKGEVPDPGKGTAHAFKFGDSEYTEDRALLDDISKTLGSGIFQAPYADYETEARLVVQGGRRWTNDVTVSEYAMPSQCHSVSALLARENPSYRHVFGWARVGDVWVMHSWLHDRKTDDVVEVTPITREEYLGVELTRTQAAAFRRKFKKGSPR
jgi:hypothetical protein